MTLVNFDAINLQWFDVEKMVDGQIHRWRLSDKATTGTTIWMAAIGPIYERIATLGTDGRAVDIAQAQQELEDRTLYLTLAIFQKNYPDMDEDTLRALFTHDERWEICEHFFSLRGAASSTAPAGGGAPAKSREVVKHQALITEESQSKKARRTRNQEEELLRQLSD